MRTDLLQSLIAQPWVEHLGWTLIHFLWQGALFAALYAFARRQRTPQFRYLLACTALAAMTIAPVVTFSLTTFNLAASDSAINNPPPGTIPLLSPNAAPLHPSPAPLPPFAPNRRHSDPMPWLVLAWFAGAIVFSIRLTGGWFVAARLRSRLTHPAPA